MAPPFKEAEFEIVFGKGIDSLGEIVDLAAERDIVQKAGAWYSYGGNKIGQGRDKTKEFFKENPAVLDEVKTKLLESLYPKKQETEEV
jgi:recombination protein RecA